MEALARLGYRADMVVDHGDFVLVEGDLLFKKSDLVGQSKKFAPSSASFQWLTDNIIRVTAPYSQELPITVDFNGLDGISPDWAAALRDGMTEWSDLSGSAVLFVEGGSPANVTVTTYHSNSQDLCGGGTDTVACANLPTSSTMGGFLYINLDFGYSIGPAARKRNMVHELGHKLGFRHSNWQARREDPSNANQYGPATDAASVMNGGTALENWAGFSFYDKYVARFKFTGFGPMPSGSFSGGRPFISWPAVTDATQYQVYYRQFSWTCPRGFCGWNPTDTSLGITTATSWTDFTHTASLANASCDGDGLNASNPTQVVSYYAKVFFPNGSGGSVWTNPGHFTCFMK